MKISLWDNVFNILKGTVKQIDMNKPKPEVTLEIAPRVEITSVISRDIAQKLHMAEGKEAYSTIDATDVMMEVD